jgi:hypothetical protein
MIAKVQVCVQFKPYTAMNNPDFSDNCFCCELHDPLMLRPIMS